MQRWIAVIACVAACGSKKQPHDAGAGSAAVAALHDAPAADAPPPPVDAGPPVIRELRELAALPGRAEDLFGHQVVASDHELFVGVPLAGAGSVAIYTLADGAWKKTSALRPAGGGAMAQLGHSIALDGDTLAASAIGDGQRGKDAGAVYVYERAGDQWKQAAKLVASEPTYQLGWRIALAGDTLAVASPWDTASGAHRGAVFVFERTAGKWQQTAKLVAPQRGAHDLFGYDVAISGDRIAVGSLGDGAKTDDPTSGAAYVFERGADRAWALAGKLVSDDRAPRDTFGNDVAFLDDAVVVSAPANNGGNAPPGAIYLFRRDGGTYRQVEKVVTAASRPFDYFGDSIATRGRTLIVGASGASHAYLFAYDGQRLSPLPSVSGTAGFGYSVALGPDHAIVTQMGDSAARVHSYSLVR